MHSPSQPLPISLCMIVKNEARLITQCLETARSFVAQMVVVDTGSSDATPSLAEAAGAEVYHHPWEGHFSIARNQSLSYAREPWVMVLDGDEVLAEGAEQALRALDLSDQAPEAYEFIIVNFTTDRRHEGEASLQRQVRLFKRAPEHGYEGLVHNQLLHRAESRPLHSAPAPVRVLHDGYTPSVWTAQGKDARLEMLERAAHEHPDDRFHHYNLGNHLKILKREGEALEAFLRALPPDHDREGWTAEWAPLAGCSGAFCAMRSGQPEVALALADATLAHAPHLIDAHLRAAEALISLARPQEAAERLRVALTHSQRRAIKLKALSQDAPYRLGRALWLSGQPAEALPVFLSLAYETNDVTVFTHAALCAAERGAWDVWSHLVSSGERLAPDDPDWPTVRAHAQRLRAQRSTSLDPADSPLYHLPVCVVSRALLELGSESPLFVSEGLSVEEGARALVSRWSSETALALLDPNAPLAQLPSPQLTSTEEMSALPLCWALECSELGIQLTLCVEGEEAWRHPARLPLPSASRGAERYAEAQRWAALTLNALIALATQFLS